MDRGRFRSTEGRDDDYEGEAQYRNENEQYEDSGNTENEAYEEYPDERERPVRKSRPSSPIPRRSHNPSNAQGTYSTRREQQGTRRLSQPSQPSQPSRRESEDRRPQRDERYERSERGEARRSQRPREEYYEETPRRLRASRPPVSRQTTRRSYSDEDERYERSSRSTSSGRRTQHIGDDSRPSTSQRSSRPAKRRSGFSSLLGGCIIGIILTIAIAAGVVFYLFRVSQGGGVPIIGGGSATQLFQHTDTQTVTLSALSQLQLCDPIGNVSVAVDPNATATTLTTTKIVHATSQTNANQEFGRIGVAVQQPSSLPATPTCSTTTAGTTTASGTPTTTTPTATTGGTGTTGTNGILTVQTNIPNSASLLRATSDAVNIQLTLTPQAFAGAASLPQLYVQAPIGNINVNGLSGVLNIRGNSGNVTVTNAKLINGSHIGTGQGNVTFNGSLASPQDTTTNASFIIQNEKGQIDVTLPNTTNVVLSADTNVGTIHSSFPITPTADGNSASFRGPLNPSATIQSIAVLTLNVSTGNITIHKV